MLFLISATAIWQLYFLACVQLKTNFVSARKLGACLFNLFLPRKQKQAKTRTQEGSYLYAQHWREQGRTSILLGLWCPNRTWLHFNVGLILRVPTVPIICFSKRLKIRVYLNLTPVSLSSVFKMWGREDYNNGRIIITGKIVKNRTKNALVFSFLAII